MSKHGKYLVAIFLVQLFGFFLVANAVSNMGHVDMDAFSMKDKFFKGEEETRFMFAVGQAYHMERDAHLVVGVSTVLIGVTSVITLWALIVGNDKPKKPASATGPTMQKAQ